MAADDRIRVKFHTKYVALMIAGGLMSFGVVTFVLWLSARVWPRVLDTEGITRRDGKRLAWSALSALVWVAAEVPGGGETGRLELRFGTETVKVVPQSIAEPDRVLGAVAKWSRRAVPTP